MDASAGTLRATGMVRAELEEHMARAEVAFVVQADVANQHMAADRRKCLKLLGSHPRLRVLVPMYVAMLLGAPVRVRFDWDDRPPTFAMCEMGLPIGDPLAGIFAKLSHAAAMYKVDLEPRSIYFSDDAARVLPGELPAMDTQPLDLDSVEQWISDEADVLHLMELEWGARKFVLHIQSRVPLTAATREATEAAFVQLHPSATVTFGTPGAGGTVHLGASVTRSRAFQQQFTQEKLAGLMESMTRVAGHSSAPPQVRLVILRSLVQTRGAYLLQGVDPTVSEPLAERVDAHAAALFAGIMGIDPLHGVQLQQLHYTWRFPSLARRALSLFLSTRSWVLHDLANSHASYSRLSEDTMTFINLFNSRVVAKDRFGSVEALRKACAKKEAASRLEVVLGAGRRARWVSRLAARDQILVASMSAAVVDAIITPTFLSMPWGPQLAFSPAQLRVVVLSFMVEADLSQLAGGGQLPADILCGRVPKNGRPACRRAVGADMSHVLHCKSGRTPRHQAVLGALRCIARDSGASVAASTTFSTWSVATATKPSTQLMADVVIEGMFPLAQFVDVSVRSPVTNVDLQHTRTARNVALERPIERAHKDKFKKYKDAAAKDNVHFVPFVMTSYGFMSKQANALLSGLAKAWSLYKEETSRWRFNQTRRMIIAAMLAHVASDQLALLNRVGAERAMRTFAQRGVCID